MVQPASARRPENRRAGARFGVVVPAKPVAIAKSRLAPLGDAVRRALATAMLTDTVTAALESRSVGPVLVVTDDVGAARSLRSLGAAAMADGRHGDLNETLRQAVAELLQRWPGTVPVALCGDLPCLTAGALDEVLERAPTGRDAFVADAGGSGTTLYTAAALPRFLPRFGPGSRAAHLEAGAMELAAPLVLRRDVDTPDELRAAVALGLGPATAQVVNALGRGPS